MFRRAFFGLAAQLAALPFARSLAVAEPEPEPEKPSLDSLGEIEARMPTGYCFIIKGESHELISWTDRQWLAMPEEDQPPDTHQDSKDGRFLVRRVADDGPLEDLSPNPEYAAYLELLAVRASMDNMGDYYDERCSEDEEVYAAFVGEPRRRVATALRRCRRLGSDQWFDLRG